MRNSLLEDSEVFIKSRVRCADFRLEDNAQYQDMLDTASDCGDNIRDDENTPYFEDFINIRDKAESLAESVAYKQGLADGLRLMALLGA